MQKYLLIKNKYITQVSGGVYGGQSKKFIKNYKKYCKSEGMIQPNDLVGLTNF